MRLSEAILAGSVLAKPEAGMLHSDDEHSCALGFAERAIGKLTYELDQRWNRTEICKAYPWLIGTLKLMQCPVGCEGHAGSYAQLIAHMFDRHVMDFRANFKEQQWTLEQLCDWVRSVEPAEDDLPARTLTEAGQGDGWGGNPLCSSSETGMSRSKRVERE